mgnify:CR=1 FL=1
MPRPPFGKVAVFRFAATMHQMPEYRLLVDGSRRIMSTGQSIQAIETEFALPPTTDTSFLYTILGGQVDPESLWVALITADGRVVYRTIGDRGEGL